MAIKMREENFVSGFEGMAYAIRGGRREPLFYLKNFKADMDIDIEEIDILGSRTPVTRPGKTKNNWEATLYECSSIFQDIMMTYVETGKMEYFDIMIANDDPNTTSGKKITIFEQCMLTKKVMAQLDVSTKVLEEEVSGTYGNIKNPTKYSL